METHRHLGSQQAREVLEQTVQTMKALAQIYPEALVHLHTFTYCGRVCRIPVEVHQREGREVSLGID
jgi:hypothetical protein